MHNGQVKELKPHTIKDITQRRTFCDFSQANSEMDLPQDFTTLRDFADDDVRLGVRIDAPCISVWYSHMNTLSFAGIVANFQVIQGV